MCWCNRSVVVMGCRAVMYLQLLLLVAAPALSLKRETSSETCEEIKYAFREDARYVYDYTVSGNSEETGETGFQIRATAVLIKAAPCLYILNIQNVSVIGTSKLNGEFAEKIEAHPLEFAFRDGLVAEVWRSGREERWVTDFKRGLLSMIQNTMGNFNEHTVSNDADITGICRTEYKLKRLSDANTKVVERRKSSNNCSLLSKSVRTHLPIPTQNLQLISSEEKCEQTITRGIIREVKCRQVVQPRTDLIGERITSSFENSLILLEITPADINVRESELKSSSLKFDGRRNTIMSNLPLTELRSLISEIEKAKFSTHPEPPHLFSGLVETLSHLSTDDLATVFETYAASSAWPALVDALLMMSTPGAAALINDLVDSSQISSEKRDIWLMYLSFTQTPELELFEYLEEFLHSSENKGPAVIAISSLINKYCSLDPECMEEDAIKSLIMQLESNLSAGCNVSSGENEASTLLYLHALENTAQVYDSDLIKSCALRKQNSKGIRIAAINALKKNSCYFERNKIGAIFVDSHEDSEMRIAAYLYLMDCPTRDLMDRVKDRLIVEDISQAGSFIWSHLQKKMQFETGNIKAMIFDVLFEPDLIVKYQEANLKLSRDLVLPLEFINSSDISTESSLIFSENNLPRSFKINMTLDSFSEKFNIVEIGGRLDGLGETIMNFLRNNNQFPSYPYTNLLENSDSSSSHRENVNTGGSYYLKLFGKLIHFRHFESIRQLFTFEEYFSIIKILKSISFSNDGRYMKSYHILDSEISYPSITGFPLIMKLNGTVNLALQMDGNFEVESSSTIDIDGYVRPSLSVQVEASLLTDLQFTKYGQKMKGIFALTLPLEVRMKVEDANLVDMKFKLSEEKKSIGHSQMNKILIIDNQEEIVDQKIHVGSHECQGEISILHTDLCVSYASSDSSIRWNLFLKPTESTGKYQVLYLKNKEDVSLSIETPKYGQDKQLFRLWKFDQGIHIITPWNKLEYENNVRSRRSKRFAHYWTMYSFINDFNSIIFTVSDQNGNNTIVNFQLLPSEQMGTEMIFEWNSYHLHFVALPIVHLEDRLDVKFDAVLPLWVRSNQSEEIIWRLVSGKLEGEGSFTYNTGDCNFNLTVPGSTDQSVKFNGTYNTTSYPPTFHFDLRTNNDDFNLLFSSAERGSFALLLSNYLMNIQFVYKRHRKELDISSQFSWLRSFKYGIVGRYAGFKSDALIYASYRGIGEYDLKYTQIGIKKTGLLNGTLWKDDVIINFSIDETDIPNKISFKFNEHKITLSAKKYESLIMTVTFVRSFDASLKLEMDRTTFPRLTGIEIKIYDIKESFLSGIYHFRISDTIDSKNPAIGDLIVNARKSYHEQNITLSWDLRDIRNVLVKLNVKTYDFYKSFIIRGNLNLWHSDLTFDYDRDVPPIRLRHSFTNEHRGRGFRLDNYLTIEHVKKPYLLLNLKGGIFPSGDSELQFEGSVSVPDFEGNFSAKVFNNLFQNGTVHCRFRYHLPNSEEFNIIFDREFKDIRATEFDDTSTLYVTGYGETKMALYSKLRYHYLIFTLEITNSEGRFNSVNMYKYNIRNYAHFELDSTLESRVIGSIRMKHVLDFTMEKYLDITLNLKPTDLKHLELAISGSYRNSFYFENKLILESNFALVPGVKMLVRGLKSRRSGVLAGSLQLNDKITRFFLQHSPKKSTFHFFNTIKEIIVDLNFNYELNEFYVPEGNVTFDLVTPFGKIPNVEVRSSWSNQSGEGYVQYNDLRMPLQLVVSLDRSIDISIESNSDEDGNMLEFQAFVSTHQTLYGMDINLFGERFHLDTKSYSYLGTDNMTIDFHSTLTGLFHTANYYRDSSWCGGYRDSMWGLKVNDIYLDDKFSPIVQVQPDEPDSKTLELSLMEQAVTMPYPWVTVNYQMNGYGQNKSIEVTLGEGTHLHLALDGTLSILPSGPVILGRMTMPLLGMSGTPFNIKYNITNDDLLKINSKFLTQEHPIDASLSLNITQINRYIRLPFYDWIIYEKDDQWCL